GQEQGGRAGGQPAGGEGAERAGGGQRDQHRAPPVAVGGAPGDQRGDAAGKVQRDANPDVVGGAGSTAGRGGEGAEQEGRHPGPHAEQLPAVGGVAQRDADRLPAVAALPADHAGAAGAGRVARPAAAG